MALLLRADGSREELPGPLTLDDLRDLVDGDIEILRLGREAHGEVLIVNENGRNLSLPMNSLATLLFRGFPPRHHGIVVGSAVVARILHAGTARERVV
jgi:hypothetical protein